MFGLKSVQVYPAVILFESLALMVHLSLLYNKAGSCSVLYCIVVVFFKYFFGLNMLLIMYVILKYLIKFVSNVQLFS